MTAAELLPEHISKNMTLTVIVVTHSVPVTLQTVLRAVVGQTDPASITLLFTGGAGSLRRSAAQQAAQQHGIHLLETPGPYLIGNARSWLVSNIYAAPALAHPAGALAFLDDDCVPRPGWRQAGEDAVRSGAALVFGPRYPASIQGLGAQVRATESRKSRKLHGAKAGAQLTAPRMLAAGGNMIVSCRCAYAYGITDVHFTEGAFEDVDFQLRLQCAGEKVEFHHALAVDHHDNLGCRDLLRKSVLSGAGMAKCAARHGKCFWACCRWRPYRVLTSRLALALCTVAALQLTAHARTTVLAGVALVAVVRSREQLAVVALGWVRDTILAVSYLTATAVLASRRIGPGLLHVFRAHRRRRRDSPLSMRQCRGRR